MAGADIRRFSFDRRGLAPNFLLGLAAGALLALAETLVHPIVVLPLFVAALTDDLAVVGLVPAVAAGVWWLGRLPAALVVGPRRTKLPWVTGAALVRTAAMVLLAYVVFRADRVSDEQLLRSFFLCYVVYHFAGGFAAGPATDVVAKAVAADQRARLFRQRVLWGGAFGVVAALVVARLLSADGPAFPRGHALLFLAAAVCLAASTFFGASLREPVRLAGTRPSGLAATLRAVPRAFADANFRRYLGFRALSTLSAVADPFFVVYAARELAVPGGAFGLYLVAFVLARFGSGLLWAPLAARQGDKALLQAAALIRLLAPLVALLLPYLAETEAYRDRIDDPRVAATLFGVVFVAIGAALGAQVQANFGYLNDIAPAALRPAYAAVSNAILALLAVAPVAGGILADRTELSGVFLAAALVGLVAVLASGALTDTHVRTRPTAAAWRLRRTGS